MDRHGLGTANASATEEFSRASIGVISLRESFRHPHPGVLARCLPVPTHEHDQERNGQQQTGRCLIFAIAAILLPGKFWGMRGAWKLRRPEAREKKRYPAPIVFERARVTSIKLALLAVHYCWIKKGKVHADNQRGPPRVYADEKSGGEQRAPEVQGIPGVGVGAGGSERLVFV